jgi:glutamate receptor, ionotropic, invertebrate
MWKKIVSSTLCRQSVNGEIFEGNQRFEGYSLDLIDAISKVLHFNYRFELVPDKNYGSYNKDTKQWDGLVKHLLDRVSLKVRRTNL